jgi:uncharacterized protein
MLDAEIQRFLAGKRFAVAGASTDRTKYGNKVLRALAGHGKNVVGLHPTETEVEGIDTYKSIADVPEPIECLSIVTPPPVTEKIVAQAIQAGVKSIWMQPGAEHAGAIQLAKDHGVDVIAGGPCLLVALISHGQR